MKRNLKVLQRQNNLSLRQYIFVKKMLFLKTIPIGRFFLLNWTYTV